MGRSGFCARRARAATSRLWANRVLPARAACRLEMGRSGFCARRARRATSRLWANRVCPRAPPAALRWADPVFARAARHPGYGNRVLPARAACRLEMGRSGFCARRARAARHPGYGRTGYCPRAPPAALRWADPVFARAARHPGYGRYCPRAPPAALRWADPVFARAARAARHPGYGRTGYCPRAPPAALRWADPVFARAARAPRDIPVMGEPGIARARRLPP